MKYKLVVFILINIFWFSSFAENIFKTGVIIPLTGPVAEYGVAIKNGIELAISENPEKFKSCQFIYEDSLYSPQQSVASFRSLTNIKNVNIVYMFGGPTGEAVIPIAERAKFPLITDVINPTVVENTKYAFRYANTNAELGAAVATELRKKNLNKILVIKAENHYINSLVNGFIKSSDDMNVQIFSSVNMDETDFRSIVSKLQGQDFDTLGVFLMPGQISNFLRTAQGRLNGKQIISGDFVESPVEVEASKGMLENTIYPNNHVDPEFKKKYLAKYNNLAQVKFGAEGHDVAVLINNLFCSPVVNKSSDEIVKNLEESKPWTGAQGQTVFVKTEKGDKYFKAPVVAMKVEVGDFIPVK